MWKPVYMYRQWLTVNFTTKFTPFRQCAHCHVLLHSTADCKRATDYTHCHICGCPGHTAREHAQKCPDTKKHTGLLCDCPIQCFNCIYAGKAGMGHLAIDDHCPLKKNMRPITNNPQPTNTQTTASTRHTIPIETPTRVDT
jgi:hypothetical protein